MPKRAMTKAEWQSIRPSELKKHGMGKALEAFQKACTDPTKMKLVQQFNMASEAAEQLATLAVKARKDAPKKHAVLDLLEDYMLTANKYRQKLDKEFRRRKDAFAALALDDIKRSSSFYPFFYAYSKKVYASENLDFLASVNKNANKEKIYKTFIATSAPRQGPVRNLVSASGMT
jgi:predicted GNAT family acetyltransferase